MDAGTFLHLCSKLCTALGEMLNNRANWAWLFLRECRMLENSQLFNTSLPYYLHQFLSLLS